MQSTLKSILQLTVCLAFAAAITANAQDKKVDPTGNWTMSYTNQSGQVRETAFALKAEGEKLTGTMSGRREGSETAISNGTIKGDEIAFEVTREFGGNARTTKYTGKISGDTIKGKSESARDGQTQSRDWEAKRAAAKPAAPPAN